ncbi:MAG: lipopolysaccharide exporter [Halioglobus sp.]
MATLSIISQPRALTLTDTAKKSLGKSISIGAIWMLGVRLSVKSLGLISSIILARLLVPGDFGIVALAMSVYALIRLIRQFGFSFALIQNQEASKSFYDTAWTMQLILSSVAALILFCLSPWAASFYEDPRLLPVFLVLSAMFFITGLENIGVVDFQKNMTFDKVFLVQVVPKIVSFVATVGLAFYLRNYWALVIGMLVNKLFSLVMGYSIQSYRPRFCMQDWRALIGFSSWLMINNVITYINRHGQNIVLAKFGGPALVGLLTVATEFASFIATEIVQPINTAAYPGYSKVAHARDKLKVTFSDVFDVVALVAFPGAVGIAAIAPLFVPVLLGNKWLEAIEIVPLVAYASILMSLMSTFDMAFIAMARQRITTALVALRVVIFFPLMYILYQERGAVGVAEAILISNILVFPLYIPALNQQLQLPFTAVLKIVARPILASLSMYFCLVAYIDYLGPMALSIAGIAALLGAAVIGLSSYVICLLVLWRLAGMPPSVEHKAINIVKSKLNQYRIGKGA